MTKYMEQVNDIIEKAKDNKLKLYELRGLV